MRPEWRGTGFCEGLLIVAYLILNSLTVGDLNVQLTDLAANATSQDYPGEQEVTGFDSLSEGVTGHHSKKQQDTLRPANEASYATPGADQYQGDVDNGALASDGFHFYEVQRDTTTHKVDRVQHRACYDELLNADTDV
jgi:hypothetical protein